MCGGQVGGQGESVKAEKCPGKHHENRGEKNSRERMEI